MNDDIEKTPANENPWYWLATVHGEHQYPKALENYRALASRNRNAWNRWMAHALSDQERRTLISEGFDASELAPLTEEESVLFLKQFAARAGNKNTLPPDAGTSIDFSNTLFENDIYFSGLIFPHHADFSNAMFLHGAYFNGAIFMHYAYFNEAYFSDYVNFNSTIFSGYAYFLDATFSRNSEFINTKFASLANIIRTTFSGDVDFSNTTFSLGADFEKASFSAGANLRNVHFTTFAYFENAIFSSWTKFNGAEFNFHTKFTNASFQNNVPDFRDAKLSEATEWDGVKWPAAPTTREEAQPQVYAYERLKAEMERLKKHADEQFFFAKELHARRVLEPRWSLRWLFNYAYDALSGYGQSVGQPILWLGILFMLGADFFALAPVYHKAPLAYDLAAGLSATNVVALLPHKPDKEITEHLSALALLVGDIQAVFGAALLFLLGLGLRNRFRMK